MSDASDIDEVDRPIWQKLAVFAAILVVPTVLVGVALLQIATWKLKIDRREYRLALTRDVGEAVEHAFDDARDGLVGVAQILSHPRMPNHRKVAVAKNIVESHELLDHVHVFDRQGARIDSIVQGDGTAAVELESLPSAIRERARTSELAVGEATTTDESVRVVAAVPIRAGDDLTGWVASYIPLDPIQEDVSFVAEYRLSPSTHPVFVVDDELRLLAHPDHERALALESAPDIGLLDNVRGTSMQRGAEQSGEVRLPSGREMVATILPIEDLPWAIVVQEPLDEAYSTIRYMRRIVWFTSGGALLIGGFLAFFLGRRLTRPVDRLVDKAKELANREFETDTDLETNDEFEVLADTMDRAGRDLLESERRIRRETEIRTDLGRYLPDDLVDGVVERDQSLELGGTRREITVLFADVVEFTPLCGELEAEAVVSILNELFTMLTEIVFRHEGTVDKFVGDSVMAFWGAPKQTDDHADRALEAAEDMIRWLEVGQARWADEWDVDIEIAVGVHTGEAVVGNIGSESRMEYTAVGRDVNVASRLEALARPGQILTTPATRDASSGGFEFREVGRERVDTSGGDVEVLEVLL